MRIMGLDFGSKTVGVAISDELLLTAQGIEIIRRKEENKLRQTLARIEELIVEYGVTEIVLGYPKNMNDTLGDRVEKTEEFKEKLERRTGLPVALWDERLTTVAADKLMMEAGIRREHRKDYVDQIAASFILQGYLDLKGNQVSFQKNENETVEYYILEQTRISGVNYLLVTDVMEGDGEAVILKEISAAEDEIGGYTDDLTDAEFEAVVPIFENLLEDVDLI